MQKAGFFILSLALLGCARVMVETKEPIKVDISMRLDIYQHLIKEVEAVENQVHQGPKKEINSLWGINLAYASSPVEDAISRRRQRLPQINAYFDAGYIGENKKAYLELRQEGLKPETVELVAGENQDRKIIYQDIARRNNVSLAEVEKIFFRDHYQRSPSGWYFQVYNPAANNYIWQKK